MRRPSGRRHLDAARVDAPRAGSAHPWFITLLLSSVLYHEGGRSLPWRRRIFRKQRAEHEQDVLVAPLCVTIRDWSAHYVTRNRTHGLDFPLFFSAHGRSCTSFPVAFARVSGNGKGVFWVVARVGFLVKPSFMLAVYLCDRVALSTSCLVHFTSASGFSFTRLSRRRPGRARGATTFCRRECSNWLQR